MASTYNSYNNYISLVLFLRRAQESENKPDNEKHPSPDYVIEDAPIASESGGKEFVCVGTDSSANDQPREVATTAKGECLYSEVVPSNKRKKHASTSSADVKADNAYSEPTGAPTNGYTFLLLAGGQENTGAPSQEALYDQPVSLIASCWDSN